MSKKTNPNKKPANAPEQAKPGEEKSQMTRTLWHPAVARAVETELEDYRKDLIVEVEHQLTTEPLRIDVLIIKKKRDVVLKKNFARIFRQCNIVEYKGPGDSVSDGDYNKTHAYARLYASLNKVDIDDLSVTVVTTRHPKNLLAFLKKRFTVRQEQQGIYLVDGEVYPTQIIVVTELSDKENIWLASLRNDLTVNQLTQAFAASIGKPNIGPFIVAIANGNKKALEELYMQRTILTEKLDVYFTEKYAAPWKAKGKAEEKVEIARNMKKEGFDAGIISRMTGLPPAEIRRLR